MNEFDGKKFYGFSLHDDPVLSTTTRNFEFKVKYSLRNLRLEALEQNCVVRKFLFSWVASYFCNYF